MRPKHYPKSVATPASGAFRPAQLHRGHHLSVFRIIAHIELELDSNTLWVGALHLKLEHLHQLDQSDHHLEFALRLALADSLVQYFAHDQGVQILDQRVDHQSSGQAQALGRRYDFHRSTRVWGEVANDAFDQVLVRAENEGRVDKRAGRREVVLHVHAAFRIGEQVVRFAHLDAVDQFDPEE